jgi:hypothetical protein
MNKTASREMKSWIECEFAIDGVLAAGGGLDGDSGFAAFASGELVLANNDEVWRLVAENIARLQSHGTSVAELLWGFENAVLCTVQREDGAWIGVWTVPKLPDQSALVLRAKLDQFRERQFAAA